MSGTEREFDALLSEGIASSEKEFFDEAMGRVEAGDEVEGDRSLESIGEGLEGRGDSEDEDGEGDGSGGVDRKPEAKAEGEKEGADADRDDKGRFKPQGEQQPGKSETRAERGLRNELTSERDKRKVVETEFANYRTETEKRFAALEARLSAPQPQQQDKPQHQHDQQKDEAPDRWADPDGYDRWRDQQLLKQINTQNQVSEQRRISWSFEDAKTKHGDAFIEAYKAADAIPPNDPAAKQIVDRIMQSANPGEQLMSWYRQQQAAREIGNDPVAFRERAKAEAREALLKDPEIRKQILAEMQGEARGEDSPRSTTRLPPSLSSARAGALSRAASGGSSDGELFADVMGGR